MLQRAASNAYSWWWASHIRTKQSKWLEQNLQDLEEKVAYTLKLIEEDGDSFAKRAEMYYKKRPELISFVEEAYRAYRALAARYDHISTELQNANNTIARVCPEEVPFIDEDDEDPAPRGPKKPSVQAANIPKVPNMPKKDLKGMVTLAFKTLKPSKSTRKTAAAAKIAKSGLSKVEGLEEIDKLQKQILGLQTGKEFVKSSYESWLRKYWEIENEIKEVQQRVCSLQDEFGQGNVIEDEEARTLMAAAALKSCQETLTQMQEKSAKDDSVKAVEEFEVGSSGSLTVSEMAEKIDEVVSKVVELETSFSSQTSLIQTLRIETDELRAQIRALEDDKATLVNDKKDLSSKLMEMEEKLLRLQDLKRSVEDQNLTEACCNLDHLAHELQIQDQLESSSQKEEKPPVQDELQKENEGRDAALNPNDGLKELKSVQAFEELEVKKSTEEANKSPAKIEFEKGTVGWEGAANLDNEDLHGQNPDEQLKSSGSTQNDEKSTVEVSSVEHLKEQEEKLNHDDVPEKTRDAKTTVANDIKEHELSDAPGNQGEVVGQYQAKEEQIKEDKVVEQAGSAKPDDLLNDQRQEQVTEQECEPDWKQMFLKGLENREKTILAEYSTILRNYMEAKKKLDESDLKTRDSNDETTMQLQELRIANTEKDEEIRSLRQKLSILQAAFGDDQSETPSCQTTDREVEVVVIQGQQPQPISEIEEKFRMDIDELLEENLDCWLRFSASFHQIHKFDTEVKDLRDDASKLLSQLEEKQKKQEGNSSTRYALKSDGRPLYKHLGEKKAELTQWTENSLLLKEELTSRCSSLKNIQEEITKALKMSAEDDDFKFTSYEAAKFQGEVLNMKQENNKVADELQAGLDHVKNLQTEVDKTLTMLGEKFGFSASKNQKLEHSDSRGSVPLRAFIFGVKQKKQRSSFFFSMHPALERKYNGFMAGVNR